MDITATTTEGVTRVYRGQHYLGSVRKTDVPTSSPRGGAYRDGWLAKTRAGQRIGTYTTRREAVAQVAAHVTVGLGH